MKSFYTRGVMFALGLVSCASFAGAAEPFGSATLLPIPSQYEAQNTLVSPAGYNRRNHQEDIPSPSDLGPTIAPEVNPNPAYSPRLGPSPVPSQMSQPYDNAIRGNPWSDNAGSCSDGSCGVTADDASCGSSCCPTIGSRWFAYGGGLIMSRANQSHHSLSQDINTYRTILDTHDAGQGTAGGFEAYAGRLLGCNGCNAFQLGYWGIYPGNTMASRLATGYPPSGIGPTLGTGLNLLEYDNGTNNYDMRTWMTTTTGIHDVSRSFNYNSAEANFLGNSYAWGLIPYTAGCGCGPRMQFGWLAGFRYFQYNDATSFYTEYDDTVLDGDDNQFEYTTRTKNSLYGFQLGGQGNYRISNCWSLYGGGRAGVFNNHINATQFIAGSAGYANIAQGAYAGQPYFVESSRNVLAGIGQVDLGVRYNLNCRLSFNGGYRVVGISGLGTSDGQLASNFADPRQAAYIRADNSVLLHGCYFGGTFMW